MRALQALRGRPLPGRLAGHRLRHDRLQVPRALLAAARQDAQLGEKHLSDKQAAYLVIPVLLLGLGSCAVEGVAKQLHRRGDCRPHDFCCRYPVLCDDE
jgi:hypothetical protein